MASFIMGMVRSDPFQRKRGDCTRDRAEEKPCRSFITGKHLPRRTFLRGMGATVALPFVNAMAPADRLGRSVAAVTADMTRLVCIEEVHGLPGCTSGGRAATCSRRSR